MLSNLKLRHKVMALLLIMAVAVAVTGGIGTWIIGRVGGEVQTLLKAHPAREKVVVLMNVSLNQCRTHLMEALLVPNGLDSLRAVRNDYEAKRDTLKEYCDLIIRGDARKGLPAAPPGSELEQRVNLVRKSLDDFNTAAEAVFARKGTLLTKLPPGAVDQGAMTDAALRRAAGEELADAAEKTTQAMDDLMITAGILTQSMNRDIDSLAKSSVYTFAAVIGLGFLLAVAFGLFASRHLVRRIGHMASALNLAKEGNLATKVEVTSRDELGTLADDFNQMMLKLSGMIGKVKLGTTELARLSTNISRAAGNVAVAAGQQESRISDTSAAMTEMNASIGEVTTAVEGLSISASESSSSTLQLAASVEEVAVNMEALSAAVEEVSASTMEMAASVKQIDMSVASLVQAASTTASSIAEMDGSIRQVEENATRTASISENVLEDAESGKKSVDAAMAGMDEIKAASAITAEVVHNLSTKAHDIGAILSVIDEVAEQTNLLALNAAIIAAQAGAHGKGFAVVADEIRELAERTSNSTREITGVINGVQAETARAVAAIEQAGKKIVEGEALSRKSGEALSKIVDGVHQASDQVKNIARATVEQSAGSRMIRQAMDHVSDMLAQIAKATGEQGRGSELISVAVERMKGLSAQVVNSTREQSGVGSFMARSTENISDMVCQVKRACAEQGESSGQIVRAVEEIQNAATANLDAAVVLERTVADITREIALLDREMQGFIVSGEASQP